jgi:SanA protein
MDTQPNEQLPTTPRWYRRRGCSISLIILIIVLFLLLSPFLLRAYTALRFRDDTYTVETVPSRRVAVIFGAQVYRNGRLSPMLRDRVATAADLYHAGKVEMILLTGDNRESNYNEPGAMRAYALNLGIPDEAILLDPLGIRTYDSCYRAYHVFDIDEAILVTQNFHLDRALLLCQSMGIDVVGVSADYHHPNGYGGSAATMNKWREVGATALAFLDLVRRPNPNIVDAP